MQTHSFFMFFLNLITFNEKQRELELFYKINCQIFHDTELNKLKYLSYAHCIGDVN